MSEISALSNNSSGGKQIFITTGTAGWTLAQVATATWTQHQKPTQNSDISKATESTGAVTSCSRCCLSLLMERNHKSLGHIL